jgi:hypothetical protein
MSSIFSNIQTTNTILGIKNQLKTQLGITPISDDNDLSLTLNTKYQLLDTSSILPTKPITIKYFGIGIGGCFNSVSDNINNPLMSPTTPYKPLSTNVDLYLPIPIRCVPVTHVWGVGEEEKYRIRQQFTIGDTEYYLYWLKVIDFDNSSLDISKINSDNSVETFNIGNLGFDINQLPQNITSSTEFLKVIVSIIGECKLSSDELLEAIQYIYGGVRSKAFISEIGFYTGEDKDDVAITGGLTRAEAIYTQLAIHRCMSSIDMSNPGVQLTIPFVLSNGNMTLIDN